MASVNHHGIVRDIQFRKFQLYGFLKNLRFFEPFIILFFRETGLSFLQIGILFAIREVSTLVLELPTGLVADIYGRKMSMILSMASYVVSFALLALFPGFAPAIPAMFAFGLGEAFRTGTHKAMILEYLRKTEQVSLKVDYYGATRAASQMGSAINALIAAALVFLTGSYRVVIAAAVIPALLNMLNLASYPCWLNCTDHEFGTSHPPVRETFRAFAEMFRQRNARRTLMNSAVFDGIFKVIKDYLQPILQTLAIGIPVLLFLSADRRTAILVGGVYFLTFLGTSAASVRSGRFSRKFASVSRAAGFAWIGGAIVMTAAGLSAGYGFPAAAAVLLMILYVIENLRRPMLVAAISDRVHARVMASGLSVESLIKMMVMTVAAPVCGFLADRFGVGWTVTIAGAAMLALYPVLKLSASYPDSESQSPP